MCSQEEGWREGCSTWVGVIKREKVLPVHSLHSETVSVTDLCDKIKANFTMVTRTPSAMAQRISYLLVVFKPAFKKKKMLSYKTSCEFVIFFLFNTLLTLSFTMMETGPLSVPKFHISSQGTSHLPCSCRRPWGTGSQL